MGNYDIRTNEQLGAMLRAALDSAPKRGEYRILVVRPDAEFTVTIERRKPKRAAPLMPVLTEWIDHLGDKP